jgi:membrane protease YdiL (CAAX protease family)
MIALLVTAVVTAASYLLPYDWKASGVGACFFGFTYFLVLRHDSATIQSFGLSLGGLFEPAPLRPTRLIRETARALAWAFGVSAVVLPFYWLGFVGWWQPTTSFHPSFGGSFGDAVLGHVLVVALPEEMFYRGYLQTALDRAWPKGREVLGARVGPGLIVSSLIFALGHLATQPHPARLAVFFPSLLFGWLRLRSGGVGASVLFHAICNLFAAFLAHSYGLIP